MLNFKEKSWPIHVPAAAVIHEWRALSVFAECIIYVDNNKNGILMTLKKDKYTNFIYKKLYKNF